MSFLDHRFRSLLFTKFFTKGWGNPQDLKRIFEFRKIISNRENCQHLVEADYPIVIEKEETQKHVRILEGHFLSPFVKHLPGIMPVEVQTARFQMVLPRSWKKTGNRWGDHFKPVCIHLGGTGDHGFQRRRLLQGRPLLKQAGIASIILENPYYGCRKPKEQFRSCLQNVSDLFVMGGALVLESMALLHWCERQGYGPLGITGISMGGHMASLAASNWPRPISLIPCLSWSTASKVFTEGVLSGAINWKLLENQFSQEKLYEDELSKVIYSPEWDRNDAEFQLGVNFAKNYTEHLSDEKNINLNQSQEKCRTSKNYMDNLSVNTNISTSSIYTTSTKLLTNSKKKKNHDKKTTFNQISNILQRLKFSKDNNNANVDKNIIHFMCGVMDECTHLGNFSVPVDPSLIIIVTAKDDAYIPRDTVMSLKDMWPGATVRHLDNGHIGAVLTKQGEFRQAIVDSFDLQVQKYYS